MPADQTAESRTERVTIACTPAEKRALEVVATVHDKDYDGPSTVLRDYSLRDAVARAAQIEQALASVGPA